MDTHTNKNIISSDDEENISHQENIHSHYNKNSNPYNDDINIVGNYDVNSSHDKISKNDFHEHKIKELDNEKILNTLRSIRSANSISNEEIQNLPGLFLDMQEALKKSNTNLLELKEKISEQIKIEKKLKSKIKNLEIENDSLKQDFHLSNNYDREMKLKLEQSKNENIKINQNLSLFNDIQKKYEEVLKDNKILKRENENILRRKNKYKSELESRDKHIDELNENISDLKKNCATLQTKYKKYKNTQGIIQGEITHIEGKLDEIKDFKSEIKLLKDETSDLRNNVKELEEERKIFLSKELQWKEEMRVLSTNNKKIKTELKDELNEKINILKELEYLKITQKNVNDKHENLKSIIETATSEIERMKQKIRQFSSEREELILQLDKAHSQQNLLEEIKSKYEELFIDYNSQVEENTHIREEMAHKKMSENEINQVREDYEDEIFILKCEINIWKFSFADIAKYKLISYDDTYSEDLFCIDKNYLYNAPNEIKEKSDGVLAYFKELIDEQSYHNVNLKSLKEALVAEQEKVYQYREQLNNELFLRRKIHNRYMSIRGNLRVMCRIRPFMEKENSVVKKNYLDTFDVSNDKIIIRENKRNKNYEFDYIFNQKSQQSEVYEEVGLLVQSMMRGSNICIISYGQTCTGKTYTIQGPNNSQAGIAIRSAKELFNLMNEEAKSKAKSICKLSLSIIEVYNENIYNLLDDGSPMLNIYENSASNLVIPDLNPIVIKNFEEASNLFSLSSKLRQTSNTAFNDRSSRSHCIYTFHLKIANPLGEIIRSKMHILDLAGSERISKSSTLDDDQTRKEAICINLSLHALSNVLNSLAMRQMHVPYRDSKLTHFLKESLNENYNILLLLHVSPNTKDLGETISTLEFGMRIVKICKHKTGKEKMAMLNNK